MHELPDVIKLESSLPEEIRLIVPENFPSQIVIDGSQIPSEIQVVGVPDSIELKGSLPSEITIKAPENLEVPLVYKGGPVPIEFTTSNVLGDGDGTDGPCFRFVPCN